MPKEQNLGNNNNNNLGSELFNEYLIYVENEVLTTSTDIGKLSSCATTLLVNIANNINRSPLRLSREDLLLIGRMEQQLKAIDIEPLNNEENNNNNDVCTTTGTAGKKALDMIDNIIDNIDQFFDI